MKKQFLTIELSADKDRNGNPRHIYLKYNRDGLLLEAMDAGYSINPWLHERIAVDMGSFKITVKEYNNLIRHYKNDKTTKFTLG